MDPRAPKDIDIDDVEGVESEEEEETNINEENPDATAEELVEKYGVDMTAEELKDQREALMRRLTSSLGRRDWALLDETKRFLNEAKEELVKLGEDALEALWEAEKEPKPKDIVSWRVMRRGLTKLIATIESAAAGSVVTAIVEECMEIEKQETLITKLALPCPWGSKRQDYLAEASRRAQSSITTPRVVEKPEEPKEPKKPKEPKAKKE